jgi:hypothetical protein
LHGFPSGTEAISGGSCVLFAVQQNDEEPPDRARRCKRLIDRPENASIQGTEMDEKDAFFEGQLTAMQWALWAIIDASPSREAICATALRGVAAHDERYRQSDLSPAIRDEFLKGLNTVADLLFAPRNNS